MTLPCLNYFIFISEELDRGAKLDGLTPVHLGALQHLDSTVALAATEWDADWEEVVRVATTGELHGASLVVLVDDSVLPQELLSPGIVCVVSLALRDKEFELYQKAQYARKQRFYRE